MTRASIVFSAALILVAGMANAQNAQPYAGMQTRPLKALSDEQIADLEAGRGMVLALAAELNGYPGPAHVLELADRLKLGRDQRRAVEAIHARMQAAAQALGREIVARESELDAAFAAGRIDGATLAAQTGTIAALIGRLRAVHLAAHLETRPLLSAEQIAAYVSLRGYGGDKTPDEHRHH